MKKSAKIPPTQDHFKENHSVTACTLVVWWNDHTWEMANERGNLLDRRKFHMMKSGSPRGMVGGKMRRPGEILPPTTSFIIPTSIFQAMLHCYGKAAKMDLQDLKTRLLKRLGLVSLFLHSQATLWGWAPTAQLDPETSGFWKHIYFVTHPPSPRASTRVLGPDFAFFNYY